MKNSFTLLLSILFLLALNFSIYAQPTSCTITNTGESATIAIQSTAQLTLDGNALPLGSIIIAMFDNNGTLTCGGYTIWNGTNTAISVYGAVPGELGFADGEVYKFRIELPGGCVIANATATFSSISFPIDNTNTYVPGSISGIATLAATSMKIDAVGQNSPCAGGTNGTAAITFTTNGIPTYDYAWSNGQSTATVSGLSAGNYTVTVTDANGCTATDAFSITQPTAINVTTSSTPAINGANNGTATALVSGGTPGYTYKWNTSPPKTTATATGLAAGNYTVTVTDNNGNNGCTKTNTTTVGSLVDCVQSSLAISSVTNNGDGTATVNATGGSTPYSYHWSNGQTTKKATGLTAGTYTVTVTDSIGCTKQGSVIITVSSSHEIAALKSLDISPNPTSGIFTVDLVLTRTEAVRIDLFDVTGKLLETTEATTAGNRFSFDTKESPNGFYLLKLSVGDASLTRRLIVIH